MRVVGVVFEDVFDFFDDGVGFSGSCSCEDEAWSGCLGDGVAHRWCVGWLIIKIVCVVYTISPWPTRRQWLLVLRAMPIFACLNAMIGMRSVSSAVLFFVFLMVATVTLVLMLSMSVSPGLSGGVVWLCFLKSS